MAAPKKEELDEIKKLLKEINNIYSKIGEKNPFASFDTKNITNAGDAIDQLNIGLNNAKKRFDDLTDGAQNLYAQLKASVGELSKTNSSIKDSIKSYNKISNVEDLCEYKNSRNIDSITIDLRLKIINSIINIYF
jgi:predicted  nucleic acid-binding Zn-ribbon protein